MSRTPSISKERVITLHDQGLSGAEIARILGVTRSRISQVLIEQGIHYQSHVKEKIRSEMTYIKKMRAQNMTWQAIAATLGVSYYDIWYHLTRKIKIPRAKKGYKYCNYCKKTLTVTHFYPKRHLLSPGTAPYSTYCKTCTRERRLARIAAKKQAAQ